MPSPSHYPDPALRESASQSFPWVLFASCRPRSFVCSLSIVMSLRRAHRATAKNWSATRRVIKIITNKRRSCTVFAGQRSEQRPMAGIDALAPMPALCSRSSCTCRTTSRQDRPAVRCYSNAQNGPRPSPTLMERSHKKRRSSAASGAIPSSKGRPIGHHTPRQKVVRDAQVRISLADTRSEVSHRNGASRVFPWQPRPPSRG